jgi:hypothetical protein
MPSTVIAENWFTENFVDPDDGAVDVSAWLERGGFFPVPIVITEPAVQNGLGFVPAWITGGDPERSIPPNVTGGFALVTGNDSQAYGAFHEGSYFNDRLRVSSALGKASINLDFSSDQGSQGFAYNIDGAFTVNSVRWRLSDSPWFAGGRWTYADLNVSLDQEGTPPVPLPPLSFGARLSGLGAILDYESLDNILTPNDGVSARVSLTRFDESIGGAFDYNELAASAYVWQSPSDAWTYGAKLETAVVTDEAPFFAKPFVTLRGVPAVRYQNDEVISTEAEVYYRFHPRWRATGFAGVGWAGDDAVFAGGLGLRYRIARRLGMDVGIDVAQGPEDTVFYIQFGRAWRRF